MDDKKYRVFLLFGYIFLLLFLVVEAQVKAQEEYLPGIKTKEEADLGVEKILEFLVKTPDEKAAAKPATEVTYYNDTSSIIKDLKYHALITKSVNCRDSLDKWDCPTCKQYFPDMQVIRTFGTYPLDITGEILLSKKKQTIYILSRGGVSLTNKITSMLNDLVDVPFIPGGKIQQGVFMSVNDIAVLVNETMTDLLRAYPNYRVHVLGHSYGAAIGSYLTVKLFHDFPEITSERLSAYLMAKTRVGNLEYAQYVKKNKIDIKRMVHLRDNAPHSPPTSRGLVHEGIEYWQFSDSPARTLKCEGDSETLECSNSLTYFTVLDHLICYGVNLSCN